MVYAQAVDACLMAIGAACRRRGSDDMIRQCATEKENHDDGHDASAVRGPILVAVSCAGGLAAATPAATYKFADQGDATSMDPHSLNESLQLSLIGNIYEPLVGRGKKLELVPLLATSWKQTAPTVWRFNLRQNVKFHDGTPFTADDVIFSYERVEGRRLRHEDQGRHRSRRCARSTTTRSTSSPTIRSRSCRTRSTPGTS